MTARLTINTVGNISGENAKKNIAYCNEQGFDYVKWGIGLYPRCAVVGGGSSAEKHFDELREWQGDVFAVNDMAGELSDNGISCYMYSVDGTPVEFKSGENVRGAVFSTRCNKNQFSQFKNVRVFNMKEDVEKDGIEGGPTGICRAPHLFLKMGYSGIDFFGCEGSFFKKSHFGSDHKDAYGDMLIVGVNGIDYITNAAFMLQCEYMAKVFTDHPVFMKNHSGGLLQAMIDNPDTWSVVAVSNDIKKQGVKGYETPYRFENLVWTN